MSEKTRVLILGSGFGGMYAALELDRSIARDPDIQVTLVNRENFFLFTPMLHEVAASDLDITHIVSPVRKLLKNVNIFNGDVRSIDIVNKVVSASHGKDPHFHDLKYDHLILSLGSITNFFGNKGLEANALTMKSLGDAIYLRNHLISNLEEADFECYPNVREPLLNFVVAGGGFAGVETIAGINDFLRAAIRFYPNLREEMLRVVLVHGGDVILPELSQKLGEYAAEKLISRGIEVKLGTLVSDVDGNFVKLSTGETIVSNSVIWTAGTAPNPILGPLACQKHRGRLCTDEFLSVPEFDGLWAIGDCAAIPKAEGKFHPPTAQHAMRQGKAAARNVAAAIRGGAPRAFKFETIGQLAAIGRRTGVAQIMGINFSGFFAWWLWRTIYLMKLPRFEKKLRVAMDWTLDLFFAKDPVQFLTLRAPTVSSPADAAETRAEARA